MTQTSQRNDGDDAILKVENLVKSFGGVAAVNDCSFEVRRGSITGLIGPNGAGKSTVVHLNDRDNNRQISIFCLCR